MKVEWSVCPPTEPGWYWLADSWGPRRLIYPRFVRPEEKLVEYDFLLWGPRIEEPDPPEVKL